MADLISQGLSGPSSSSSSSSSSGNNGSGGPSSSSGSGSSANSNLEGMVENSMLSELVKEEDNLLDYRWVSYSSSYYQ